MANPDANAPQPRSEPLEVVVSGAGGLIGAAVAGRLEKHGHRIRRMVRHETPATDEVSWNPATGVLNSADLAGTDAVVHLAGAGVADRRWTRARKALIRSSRVDGTRLLSESLARLERPPSLLVSASAIGYYGSRGDEILDESSAAGTGFLADVCTEWEAAAQPAVDAGVRVVFARFGVVLSPAGGALSKMLLPFRCGAGGRIGSGRQYWSWIGLDDAVDAVIHAITSESVAGPMNVVAPNPVSNAEFTRALARVLRRPAIVPMPATAARIALGEMADELLLSSANVTPKTLLHTGYAFRHPSLESCLTHLLR